MIAMVRGTDTGNSARGSTPIMYIKVNHQSIRGYQRNRRETACFICSEAVGWNFLG